MPGPLESFFAHVPGESGDRGLGCLGHVAKNYWKDKIRMQDSDSLHFKRWLSAFVPICPSKEHRIARFTSKIVPLCSAQKHLQQRW